MSQDRHFIAGLPQPRLPQLMDFILRQRLCPPRCNVRFSALLPTAGFRVSC